MKSKLGMAVTLGLIATGAFASSVFAQCGTGPIIEFDNETWAYESNYNPATFHSSNGDGSINNPPPASQLTVVGKITLFCNPPFNPPPDATSPNEYTLIMTGLTSTGTVHTPLSFGGMKHETLYSGGTFFIYEDNASPDAPTLATLQASPPNVQVPARFVDGTLILSGTLANFRTTVTLAPDPPPDNPDQYTHSMRADYQFTGPAASPQYQNVAGTGVSLITSTWCANGSANGLCVLPNGYSAQPNGKFDNPPTTVTQSSTWGTIKQIYR